MEKRRTHVLQWHPAFYADIQIELEAEAGLLIFENEHQLGTKPKEIDVLIVKKEQEVPVRKNIGRIFRKYNIVEYKSPTDYLSIDDFYKVYGYACFYKADTSREDSIKIQDITITFVCHRYPRSLMRHLKEERGYQITGVEDGIYYIIGDKIPIQMILTKELSEKHNLWLKSLTDDLEGADTVRRLIEQYGEHTENKLYQSVMNLIVRATQDKFKEVKTMCEALEELMKDEMDAKKAEGKMEGKTESVLDLLLDLGEVPEKLRAEIMGQKNPEILKQWIKYAARAETVEEFEQKIRKME